MPPDRKSYLGGTDLAPLLGLSPYKTAHDVWMEKTGRAPPKETNLAMRIGVLAEPMLRTLYEEQTQRKLVVGEWRQHPSLSFIGGTVDALDSVEPMSVELKTANIRTAARWGEDGTDEVPEEYLIQVQTYLSVWDHDRADLAVLLGGSDFRVYHILRDRELEGEMLDRAAKFWTDHVLADVPPPIDGSPGAASMLAKLHPTSGPEFRDTNAEAEAAAITYAKARTARQSWEAVEEKAKQQLQAFIGDAKGVQTSAGKALWTACRGRVGTNWEAVAAEANAPKSLIQKHTTIGAGFRRFTFTPKE